MNYQLIYKSLIESRRINTTPSDYYEIHHIVPRSLGGTNGKSNLVKLTAREHFIAHLLLAKIHGGTMWYALRLMSGRVQINSHTFEMMRKEFSKAHRERMLGRIPHNKGVKTPKHVCEKQSNAHKGKKLSLEHRQKLLLALSKRERDQEWADNISKSLKGHAVPKEVRLKISDSLKGNIPYNKGVPDVTVKCPHCGKEGGRSIMKRWHFERCKLIQNKA